MRQPDTWILTEVKFDETGIPYCYREPQPCKQCAELRPQARKAAMKSLAAEGQQAERIHLLEYDRATQIILKYQFMKELNNSEDVRKELEVRITTLESALTEAVDEIASLACRDNSCDPHPDLSEYTLLLQKKGN